MNAEAKRLQQKNWKHWGPYLSERAWGTVREDYSADGSAWDFFPHDHARSRAYRWNEDGIAGICDENQHICFSVAFWNGKDPILKERIFGLTGNEGNHGEDVKEYYFYVDSTPTHSYMKYLYKYPQGEFPYSKLLEENRNAGKLNGEFELLDSGIFNDNKYFDCFIEYAKADADDILIKITVANRGAEMHKSMFCQRFGFVILGRGKSKVQSSKSKVFLLLIEIRLKLGIIICFVRMLMSCCFVKIIRINKNYLVRKMNRNL